MSDQNHHQADPASISVKDLHDQIEGLAVGLQGVITALKHSGNVDMKYLDMLLLSALKGLSQPFDGKVERPKMREVLELLQRAAAVQNPDGESTAP